MMASNSPTNAAASSSGSMSNRFQGSGGASSTVTATTGSSHYKDSDIANKGHAGSGGVGSWLEGMSLRSFDLYTKIDREYVVKTASGGTLTLIGWCIIVVLLVGQTYSYLTPVVHEHMEVNTTLGERLPINIDITFHALTCADAHLDAMDVAGDNQLNMEDTMYKQRISKDGVAIGGPTVSFVGEAAKHEGKEKEIVTATHIAEEEEDRKAGKVKCLSCYGAETAVNPCCNTCQALKDAYAAHGWGINDVMKTSEQCKKEPTNPWAHVGKDEGCRVHGSMVVNRVAGNMHIAHGESIVRDGRHIHQFNAAEAPFYNISHTIHRLSFGTDYPNMAAGPLDNTVKIVDPKVGTGLYQYFIKVIPTVYKDSASSRKDDKSQSIYTNQYTMTERFRPLFMPTFPRLPDGTPDLSKGGQRSTEQAVLPGIFFVYDVSPFLVEVVRSRVPFLHYFTRACATVGGVFAVLGVADKLLHKLLPGTGGKRL